MGGVSGKEARGSHVSCTPREEQGEEEDEEPELGRARSVDTETQQAPADAAKTILQFTSAVYFVEEEEGKVVIDVMRLGSQSGRASCLFSTADGSGKAGERYDAFDGELVFESGVMRQSFEVEIVQGDQWEATLEFKVCLSGPEDCTLGLYLHTCRVKVIDSNTFPTSKYPEVAQGLEAVKSVGGFMLFREYCKMNYGVKGIAWRTNLCLVMDQIRNLYLFYKLAAMAYMLNVVFENVEKNPSFTIGQRAQVALWIGAGYILPMAVLHAWDLVRIGIDISGHSRGFMQTSLIRKYLNYDEQSRDEVSITEIQIAVREDAVDMAEGYMALLSLLNLTGKLLVMLYFTLLENPHTLTTVMIMPGLMLVWGCFRHSTLREAIEKTDDLERYMLAYVGNIHRNYRLISNYQQRPKVNDAFAQKVVAWRSGLFSPHMVKTNNHYFTEWLGPVFVGIYIMTQATNVLTGVLGPGTFVATLSVFGEISGDFSAGYDELMKISSVVGALQGVTELMNRKTNLMSWKTVNRHRRENTKRARDAIVQDQCNSDHSFPTDLMTLNFKGVGFSFPSGKAVLKGVDLSVLQGSMVAIELGGDHGGGRQTFLRLIAHELFPSVGEVFIPTHLRILHVSQEPLILDGSMLQNLNFGCNSDDDVNLERVEKVLRSVGSEKLLHKLQQNVSASNDDFEDLSDFEFDDSGYSLNCCAGETSDERDDLGDWQKALSYTETVYIHLARAFIMNPEVMILQRPLLHFSAAKQDKILNLIREHVDNRGLGLPPETVSSRRPRTVFVSVENNHHARQADVVWKMQELKECSEKTSTVVVVNLGSAGETCRAPWPPSYSKDNFY